jgi:hypothetical protein
MQHEFKFELIVRWTWDKSLYQLASLEIQDYHCVTYPHKHRLCYFVLTAAAPFLDPGSTAIQDKARALQHLALSPCLITANDR